LIFEPIMGKIIDFSNYSFFCSPSHMQAVIKQIIQKEPPPLPEKQYSNTIKLLVAAMMQKEPEM